MRHCIILEQGFESLMIGILSTAKIAHLLCHSRSQLVTERVVLTITQLFLLYSQEKTDVEGTCFVYER